AQPDPAPTPTRSAKVATKRKLPPSRLRAYGQFLHAVKQNAALDSDREVYDWLKENLDDDETLPIFSTWRRYVTEARKANETNKHTSRAGRPGRSILTPDKI